MKNVDFDKYIKERKKVAPQFMLFGKTYTLPPTMSYKAMLYIQSLVAENPDKKVEDDDMLYFFKLLFNGDENVDEWKNHPDFDMDLISTMTEWVLEAYNEQDPKSKTTLKESQAS